MIVYKKWLATIFLFANSWVAGATYVKVDVNIQGQNVTIMLETESAISADNVLVANKGTHYKALVDELFDINNEGITFNYGTQKDITYNRLIGNLPLANQTEVRDAFAVFRAYTRDSIRRVVASNSNFDAKVNIESKSPLAAANKDIYRQVVKLGRALGVSMPDPEEPWYSRYFGKKSLIALSTLALLGGGILAYKYWNQVPTVIGTSAEACGTGVELVGKGVSKTGGGIQTVGRGIKGAGTWIKTPRLLKTPQAPAPAPAMPTELPVDTAPRPDVNIPAPTPESSSVSGS